MCRSVAAEVTKAWVLGGKDTEAARAKSWVERRVVRGGFCVGRVFP